MQISAASDHRQAMPAVLAGYHLPPQRASRCTQTDRLVYLAASYSNRPVPVPLVEDRCMDWFQLKPRATHAALRRLEVDGAIAVRDNRVHRLRAYSIKARQQHQLFQFHRHDVERFTKGELSALSLSTLALLRTRSSDDRQWADSHGFLARMLGASRNNVGASLKSLLEAGDVQPVHVHKLRNGHVVTAWQPVDAGAASNATSARVCATSARVDATSAQSGTLRDLVPSVSASLQAATVETRAPQGEERQKAVEGWLVETLDRGIETLTPEDGQAVAAVTQLLGKLDPLPAPQFARQRLAFAKRLCEWSRSSERLATWMVRVLRHRGVSNLLGYLRTASKRGDPGTALGMLKSRVGRGAETWQDFTSETERAVTGEYASAVEKLCAAGAAVFDVADDEARDQARQELRRLLFTGQKVGAGRVLRHWFHGKNPSDVELRKFVDGVCDLQTAKEALAA